MPKKPKMLCGVCRNKLKVTNSIFQLQILKGDVPSSQVITPRIKFTQGLVPIIIAICSQCGNMHFLSVKVLGSKTEKKKKPLVQTP